MKTEATIKYLGAVLIYGTIGYFLHYINCASEFVVMCRGIIGSIFIFLVMLLKKDLPDFKAIKKNLPYLVVSGVCLGINWIFLFAGYEYAISITSLLNYIAPIIAVIVSVFLYKEKLSKKQIICVILAFLGIILLSGIFEEELTYDYHCFLYGFIAAIAFVVIMFANKKQKNIKPLDRTIVQLFISFLTVLPVVLIRKLVPVSLDDQSIRILIMLGIVHTGIAYILYFNSIDSLPMDKVAILGYVEPVLTIIIGTVVFKENMTLLGAIGAILILFSALYSEIRHK